MAGPLGFITKYFKGMVSEKGGPGRGDHYKYLVSGEKEKKRKKWF